MDRHSDTQADKSNESQTHNFNQQTHVDSPKRYDKAHFKGVHHAVYTPRDTFQRFLLNRECTLPPPGFLPANHQGNQVWYPAIPENICEIHPWYKSRVCSYHLMLLRPYSGYPGTHSGMAKTTRFGIPGTPMNIPPRERTIEQQRVGLFWKKGYTINTNKMGWPTTFLKRMGSTPAAYERNGGSVERIFSAPVFTMFWGVKGRKKT